MNENKKQNIFFSKMLSFFLNQSNSNFYFAIEYCGEYFTINISYQQTRELNIELAKLFSNVSYQVQQLYFGEEQASLELGEVMIKLISLESDKITVGDKVTVIESFAAKPKIAILFFNAFLAQMKIGDKIEVLHI
ncbi:MAG: hypothetical protein WAU36_04045 [Cyclobacteriaceae bacterium]